MALLASSADAAGALARTPPRARAALLACVLQPGSKLFAIAARTHRQQRALGLPLRVG
jgi:hypothetical protein